MYGPLGILFRLINNLLPLFIIYLVWKYLLNKSGKSSPLAYLLNQIRSARTDYLIPETFETERKLKQDQSKPKIVTNRLAPYDDSLTKQEASHQITTRLDNLGHQTSMPSQLARKSLSNQAWKQAIIYKEILDQPLALRDKP